MTLRAKGITLLLISLAGVGVALPAMIARSRDYNQTLPTRFHFQRQFARDFTFRGSPVSLKDSTDAEGRSQLTLTYGSATESFRVSRPVVQNFKDLSAFEERVTVLAFTPIEKGKVNADPYSDLDWRSVVVSRQTADGWDEETWGEVRVRDWVFAVYELQPNGTISKRLLQFPDRRGRLPAEVDARRAAAKEGKTLPDGPLPPEMVGGVEKIAERSWEWQACLFAVPKSQLSRYRFQDDAIEAMGWSLPVMGVSILSAVGATAMIMAARTRRR